MENPNKKPSKKLMVHVIEAKDLPIGDIITSDPYCNVYLMETKSKHNLILKTRVVPRTLNPYWNEHVVVEVTDAPSVNLQITVMDKDAITSDDVLGSVNVTVEKDKEISDWIRLPTSGRIKVRLSFGDNVKEYFTGALSNPTNEIKKHYQVLVVGSGYGGAIAAARCAQNGLEVCLLERGKEFLTGDFPNNAATAVKEMQLDPCDVPTNPNGLYHFSYRGDVAVFHGCGLGGTSLVNANVCLEPHPSVWKNKKWPSSILKDPSQMSKYYKRVSEMLRPTSVPEKYNYKKLQLMEKIHGGLVKDIEELSKVAKFTRPPLAVTFEEGPNAAQVYQKACINCGDCCSGCNHGAKNTTMMNYLPLAKQYGASIFTEVEVRSIEKSDDNKWIVHCRRISKKTPFEDINDFDIIADRVVLGAGTLGTTEILLRSSKLPLSKVLGTRFSGNGDYLAFAYNSDYDANSIGLGNKKPDTSNPIGPCISGLIDVRDHPTNPFVIEDGTPPGAIGIAYSTFLAMNHTEDKPNLQQKLRFMEGKSDNTTLAYLVMSHDDDEDSGTLVLEEDHVAVKWKGYTDKKSFKKIDQILSHGSHTLGGMHKPSPVVLPMFQDKLISVHPLGGCVMGDSIESGVVDEFGRVFNPKGGVYDGLYITDGSAVPCSLGVNPFMTISALAERSVEHLIGTVGQTVKPQRVLSFPTTAPGLTFVETMSGKTITFTLKITIPNLDACIADPNHAGLITGKVKTPDGEFDAEGKIFLLKDSKDDKNTLEMTYQMNLTHTKDAKNKLFYHGWKTVHDDPGFDMWHDTTTMAVKLFPGHQEIGRSPFETKGMVAVAEDTIYLTVINFMKQLSTMTVPHAKDVCEELECKAKFGEFFMGRLWFIYGFAKSSQHNTLSQAPKPRAKRAMELPVPFFYYWKTKDGQELRLTRFKNTKDPVVLAHGMGVSSIMYVHDTQNVTLSEYLWKLGYDVWLFDWRASIIIPSAHYTYNPDDVAKYDWPSAIDTMLDVLAKEKSPYKQVHAIVHCIGSVTFFLSMLGLYTPKSKLRSVIALQVAIHPIPTKKMKALGYLHTANLYSALFATINPVPTGKTSDVFLNLLKFAGPYHCDLANAVVCDRISALYGLLWQHDKMSVETHLALEEIFGVAMPDMFVQISAMVRAGHLVDHNEENVYMGHENFKNLDLPITFFSGEKNLCFIPEATLQSFEACKKHNPQQKYNRVVIKGYGHIDCVIGKEAEKDVFPYIAEHLKTFQM